MRNLQKEVTSAARDIEGSVRDTVQSTQKDFDSLSSSLTGDADPAEKPSIASSAATDWKPSMNSVGCATGCASGASSARSNWAVPDPSGATDG
ncbi:MAG: hypothetical protein R3E68_18635 [Burkholderiaceae bacterium]